MKRVFSVIAVLFLSIICSTSLVYADNQVEKLEIEIALYEDGSAHILQDFYVVTDEGTEFYLERLDSGYLEITDFSVSDETGKYIVLEEWDVDASFEEKAGKCGMRSIDGGKELCWGITEYGTRKYTIEYVIHNFVSAYSDQDGFFYRIIDPYQDVFPTDAVVTICKADGTPLTDEACDIWAFGYDGQIQFEDGVIKAFTQTALEDAANMTLMVSFEKGLLNPVHKGEGSFEDVKTAAFEGSDYESAMTDTELLGLLVIFGLLIFGVLFGVILFYTRKKSKQKKMSKEAEYFRDIPNDGNLNMTYVLGSGLEFFPDDQYLGVRMLRLITLGSIEPLVTGEKEDISLKLIREPRNGDIYDEVFYTFLQGASGADGILQSKELEAFCKDASHAKSLNNVMESCEKDGKTALVQRSCLKGTVCKELADLTPEGNRQLQEILGFKKYLQEFSLMEERNIKEAFLWQEYIVYAMLFGITDEVIKQMKELYPDYIPQIEKYQRYMGGIYSYDRILYRTLQSERQRQQTSRSSGSGGRASFSGGSGFSGGGGMGTR